MHTMTFFPLGNADTCLIELANGKKVLFDFADMHDEENDDDLRINLSDKLRSHLKEKKCTEFEVVAFTHLDNDHTKGTGEFFRLEHAEKYQGDGRIKIKTLWVPAAVITEPSPDEEDARLIQAEARFRFKEGKGIRVFSRPERLEDWCNKQGITWADHKHLITDAGKLAGEFSLANDGAEFFVHSPFAWRQDETTVEDRNEDALLMQVTFSVDGEVTRALMLADATHEVLADIVTVTKNHKREDRLSWDILKVPHHCSYRALNDDDNKGVDKTTPVEEVAWLIGEAIHDNAIAVITSDPIPGEDTKLPPHRQAFAYYKGVLDDRDGKLAVTMEYPTRKAPGPIVIEIGNGGAKPRETAPNGRSGATSGVIPRAG